MNVPFDSNPWAFAAFARWDAKGHHAPAPRQLPQPKPQPDMWQRAIKRSEAAMQSLRTSVAAIQDASERRQARSLVRSERARLARRIEYYRARRRGLDREQAQAAIRPCRYAWVPEPGIGPSFPYLVRINRMGGR